MVSTLRAGMRLPFSQFWPMYLDAHRRPGTRAWHYIATLCGISSTLLAAIEGEILIMVAGILSSYCIAIGAHKWIEHNKPLIGVNPILGAYADLKMFWFALRGALPGEYVRLGLRPITSTDGHAVTGN
ncbi:MAG TPA: DUF962 domain-containing protein [Dongiaceae bacterium]|nr:DUF962 domain-containing protein [Dongiaceae bacterium]